MRKLGIKLSAFDLLYWVNSHTVSNDVFEQTIVRNSIINLLDLYDHWCKDENECEVCQRPESVFVSNRIGELVNHAAAVEASERKYAELSARFARSNIDMSVFYSAFLSPESDTVIRSTAHQGVIDDYGNISYSRRAAMAVLGSDQPVVVQSEGFGKSGYDSSISLTVFLNNGAFDDSWSAQNTLASGKMVDFIKESLGSIQVGDIEIPTSVERIEAEVLALGGIREGERDAVSIERHVVSNANKSHPVLGRLATPDSFWLIVSEGAGRSLNDAMRVILDSKGDPSLTTSEAITLASIVFSKRGMQQHVSP